LRHIQPCAPNPHHCRREVAFRGFTFLPDKEIAMKQQLKKAARVAPGAVAEMAREGLERAVAARRGAVELNAEQVDQVSGGVLSLKLIPIIAGGIMVRPINVLTGPLAPQGNPAALEQAALPTARG
jgi:hypothetical protein